MPEPWIIAGDFNINDNLIKSYLPKLLEKMNEVELTEPTTPKGHKYDHIIFSGLKLVENKIHKDVFTDHYPVVAVFEY